MRPLREPLGKMWEERSGALGSERVPNLGMGLFSKRRTKGFDPELWSDATSRGDASEDKPWFSDLDETGDDPALDDLATNGSADFGAEDASWLNDDPGDQVRKRRS